MEEEQQDMVFLFGILKQEIQYICVLQNFNMTEFELWYAYYDSLFLNSTPNLPQTFCLTHTLNKAQWPSTPCLPLSQCFSLLEAFLKCGENWITSKCTIEQLNTISDNLNILLHFLSLEKQYASAFWATNSRRVQSSITHLYCFLQNLVRAIIPYSSMTIFQCKAAHKLCVQLSKLQQMFKKIFKHINSLAQFLSCPKFSEQSDMIVNFFENFVFFMKQLPKIKRNKLNHVHNLTRFICLTNPIQICRPSKPENVKKNRKKSCTIGTAYELKTADYVLLSQEKMENTYRRFYDYVYRIPRKSNSCENFNYPEIKKQNIKKNFIKIFSFPERINKSAESSLIQKKSTLDSYRTLTTKMDSISKNKSSTMASLTSPLSMKRMKTTSAVTQDSPTLNLKKKPSMNRTRGHSNIKFYEEEEQRFQLNSISSFRASFKQFGLHKMQGAIQVNENIGSTRIFQYKEKSRHVCVFRGTVTCKGWETVRQWFWQRVKMRKLKKILDSPQFF